MANRTQIVCLCEGRQGQSIDEIFIYKLIKLLQPSWLRSWEGNNPIRPVSCGSRHAVVMKMPEELRHCLSAGGQTTLMVLADCDDDCAGPEELKKLFWDEAQRQQITRAQFDQVVFIFAKDRLENWIEFLATGHTDESREGPRVNYPREAADASRKLATMCSKGKPVTDLPPSLQWSCTNWKRLCDRMRNA